MSSKNTPAGEPQDLALEMAVLARLLKAEQRHSGQLFDMLAPLLQSCVPEQTTVTLGGWPWHKNRPVTGMVIVFDDVTLEMVVKKNGAVAVTHRKIVRGITLKSTVITMQEALREIVAKLAVLESQSAQTRDAMRKIVMGDLDV